MNSQKLSGAVSCLAAILILAADKNLQTEENA